MKTRNAENPDKSRLSAKFLASRKGFEPPTPALGGQTYPLEGVCNIRFLHKIRIFRDFRVKNELFSVTFADFTESPERVAPRRCQKWHHLFKTERNYYFEDASPASFSVSTIEISVKSFSDGAHLRRYSWPPSTEQAPQLQVTNWCVPVDSISSPQRLQRIAFLMITIDNLTNENY